MCVLWNGNASVGVKEKTHHCSQVTLVTVENGIEIGWKALMVLVNVTSFKQIYDWLSMFKSQCELLWSSKDQPRYASVFQSWIWERVNPPYPLTGGDQVGSRSEFPKGRRDLDVDISWKKLCLDVSVSWLESCRVIPLEKEWRRRWRTP